MLGDGDGEALGPSADVGTSKRSVEASEGGCVALIVATDGQIQAISPPVEGEARARFLVGAKIFEYFNTASADALRSCIDLAIEQSAPNACWPVCTSMSSEAIVFEAQVVSLGSAGSDRLACAITLRYGKRSGDGCGAASGRVPKRPRPLQRDVRTVAHELNNLLTTMMSFAGFLMDDLAPDDPRRSDVGVVLTAVNEAARLVSELAPADSDS